MGRFRPAAGPPNSPEWARMELASSRSAITNLKRLHDGVDGKSAGARRFKDLIRSLSADFDGFEKLGEGDRALVRQAATLTMEAERMQAASVRGEAIDDDVLIRVTSTLRRVLSSIRARVPAKAGGDLHGYLAEKRAAG